LGNLSGVLKDMGDCKAAKEGYERVIEIYKKQFGEENIRYAKNLLNLSDVLRDLEEFKSAKEGYVKALEIYKKIFGENDI
jgi:tetratricopeptide (TPR) repeat protein